MVYMDFNKDYMQAHGGAGAYESLDPGLLPRLWLIYCDNPSDSGRVHSTVKQRWLAGDPAVVEGMQEVAKCAADGRCVACRGACMQHSVHAVWAYWQAAA